MSADKRAAGGAPELAKLDDSLQRFLAGLSRAEKRGREDYEQLIRVFASGIKPEDFVAIVQALPEEQRADLLASIPELQEGTPAPAGSAGEAPEPPQSPAEPTNPKKSDES